MIDPEKVKWIREKTEHGHKDITIDYKGITWVDIHLFEDGEGSVCCHNTSDFDNFIDVYESPSLTNLEAIKKAIEILTAMKEDKDD